MTARVAAVLSVTVVLAAVAFAPAMAGAGKAQTTCPVSGEPIDRNVHVDYQGQRVYFCCESCPAELRKDPEKYFAKLATAGVELENVQTTCPVSGEKLGEGDMGEPVSIQYQGRTVKFCCKMCVDKFQQEPAKYLAKLPGEQPTTR